MESYFLLMNSGQRVPPGKMVEPMGFVKQMN
jgi:hypothetical protein